MRAPSPRTVVLVLAAAVMLLVSATGGAVAGRLITGKQIKDGSIAKRDLAPSARGLQGPQGEAGPQGAPGQAGQDGAQGDPGPRGFSAWEAIPSGVTVTGEVFYDSSTTGSNGTDTTSVSLPGVAPVALSLTEVNFKAGTPNAADSDAACTGTAAAPTAPPGKVCLYSNGTSGLTLMNGRIGVLPKRGFTIEWKPSLTAGTDMYLDIAWAYTAP